MSELQKEEEDREGEGEEEEEAGRGTFKTFRNVCLFQAKNTLVLPCSPASLLLNVSS